LTLYGPVVVNGLLIKIYEGREARALAIAAIGISLASATLPPLVGILLEYWDWRITLGILVAVLLPVWWLVVLSGFPRGVVKAPARQGRVSGTIYRQPAFWLIGLCVALAFNVSIVLAVCYPPLFASKGYSVVQAGWFLALAGVAGLTGKTCVAWLGDAARVYAKWVAIGLLLLQVVGLAVLFSAGGIPGIMLAMVMSGFGGGAFIPMHPYLNSQYFDVQVIGEVNGAQMPLFLPFALVGAPLAGYTYDQTGSYQHQLVALAVVLCVAGLIAWRLPSPGAGPVASISQ
jgi:predicted MFS family arabinose efflux permease